ncbi:unnamed protein product [Effrenium voratum]|nr:unnamed protein product [Effrenium voratum]
MSGLLFEETVKLPSGALSAAPTELLEAYHAGQRHEVALWGLLVLLVVAGFVFARRFGILGPCRSRVQSDADAVLDLEAGLASADGQTHPGCREADELAQALQVLREFSLKDLEEATGGFTCKLGGGFNGTVYRGQLKDGTQVAVKVADAFSFSSEIQALAKTRHPHVITLMGFARPSLLVYELAALDLRARLLAQSSTPEHKPGETKALDEGNATSHTAGPFG